MAQDAAAGPVLSAPTEFALSRYHLDLATGAASIEEVRCQDLEDVLGGIARGFKLLEALPVQDPYDPASTLILNLGVLSGSEFMTGLRTFFMGYSPLKASRTGTPSTMWTAGSGKFGTKLRHAGVDEVLITGRSAQPSILRISQGEGEGAPASFELLDGSALYGMRANQKIQTLKQWYPDAHFAVIGPAGENYEHVRYAAIALSTVNQLRSGDMKSRFCGRGGFGGVLGSKNLIAIVADGPDPKGSPPSAALKEINKIVARGDGSRRFRDAKRANGGGGTWANLHALNPLHASPEYNFQPTGTDLSVPLYRENVEKRGRVVVKDEACFRCGIACHKNIYEADAEGKPGRFLAKFDYEPLNLLSSNIGIFDEVEAAELVELVDDLCMDSISIGVTLSYAMEFNRRHAGNGAKQVAGGLAYGDFEGARKAIELIGTGQLPELGQGSKRLGEQLGEPGYAMQCKGVEFPAYLPQTNPGYPWALAGGHMSMRTYLLCAHEREVGLSYWIDAVTNRGLSIMRDDMIGICKFAGTDNAKTVEAIQEIAGLAITEEELVRVLRRTFLRGYLMERKQGFTDDDYRMPEDCHRYRREIDLPYFNTRSFHEVLRRHVNARFDAMAREEGLG